MSRSGKQFGRWRMPHAAVGPGLVGGHKPHTLTFRPEFRQDYPLNLSISLSGGKETNQDSLSSGERTGKSPT